MDKSLNMMRDIFLNYCVITEWKMCFFVVIRIYKINKLNSIYKTGAINHFFFIHHE